MITKGWVAKCQEQAHSAARQISPVKLETGDVNKDILSPIVHSQPQRLHNHISPSNSKVIKSPAMDSETEKSNQINLKVCENILETIMSDKMRHCSEPFLKITTRYSNDSYTPMDLSQIKENLSKGFYRTAQEFATDFRRMISETYRFCIDKDPLIQQAQELQHQFEMAFAKRIQFTQDDFTVAANDNLDSISDDTVILKKILAIGRAMEMELDSMIKKELAVLEEKRFNDAQLLVKEIENVPPEVMEDVIQIMQRNKEELQVEPDGTVEVSYNDLSAKTINEIRKLLQAKNLCSSQNGFNVNGDIREESMNIDIS